MKKISKLMALFLCLAVLISCIPAAFAADVADATIDEDAAASLTLYKYDWTNAHKDGVWNEDSFISTGWKESYVEETLGGATRVGADGTESTLGNGETSYGYALKGVEFSFLRVADIVTYSEVNADGENETVVLYGFPKDSALIRDAFELITGYEANEKAYAPAADSKLDQDYIYYESDTLNQFLKDGMASVGTDFKTLLEVLADEAIETLPDGYMWGDADDDGYFDFGRMPLTDEHGMTSVEELDVGLYLIVETKVPEMVTITTDPFFVSLPMTTVSGNEHSESPEGGHYWNYDVTLYPKNQTGNPTLEKTVRESAEDTGKNNASDEITDGYEHSATASAGDILEYQILSTLPTITSKATSLSVVNFYDTIVKGLDYNKDAKDVKIEIFKTEACNANDKVASWDMDSGMFTVAYSADGRTMTVDVTAAGLKEINGGNAYSENAHSEDFRGYSNYTIRVTYTCKLNSSAETVYGEDGNQNKVVLTWKRTSSDFYDTLIDDAHVYSFGIDLTKTFSDLDVEAATDAGMYEHVKFKIWNETDGYWVNATLNEEEGIYYVDGFCDAEEDATVFSPVTYAEDEDQPYGHIMVQGLEDDEYVITEIETYNGYTLLKDDINVIISAVEGEELCDIYSEDELGLLQNDPRYSFNNGSEDLTYANIPQKQLAHFLLTASATVDGNEVTMSEDAYLDDEGNEVLSLNAFVDLTVKNTRGFNPPKTGDNSAQILALVGTFMAVAAVGFIALMVFKRKKEETAQIQ